jgi:hypothetical protein
MIYVAQAAKPAEPRVISAFLSVALLRQLSTLTRAAVHQRFSSGGWIATNCL